MNNNWEKSNKDNATTIGMNGDQIFGKKINDTNIYMYLTKVDGSQKFNCIRLYNKPTNMTDTEFFQQIFDGKTNSLGNFSINCKSVELDKNNNLLLETYGAELKDMIDNSDRAGLGNMIVSKSGEVLASFQKNTVIEPADENGYYKKTRLEKNTEQYLDNQPFKYYYNFLDDVGEQVSTKDIAKSKQNKLVRINRKYNDLEKCDLLDPYNLYPDSFISISNDEVLYFPSAPSAIIEHRKRQKAGKPHLLDAEVLLIKSHYERKENIDYIVNLLGISFDRQTISPDSYKKALEIINKEYEFIDEFEQNFENIDERDSLVKKAMEKM